MKVIKSAGKSIGNALKKVYKEVTSSKVGKSLLIAATVYIGGAALGAWNSPFTSINGVLAKGGGTAATGGSKAAAILEGGATTGASTGAAAGASTTGGTVNLGSLGATKTAASSALPGTASAAPISAAGGTGTMNLAALTTPGAPPAIAGTAANAGINAAAATGAGTAAAEGVTKGIIGKTMAKAGDAAKAVGTFVKDEPMLAYMGMNALSSALSPDEMDIMREQERLRQEREDRERARQERNLDVAGINIGIKPTGRALTDSSGNPVYDSNGIINRVRFGA
jgi:hypothetical protein